MGRFPSRERGGGVDSASAIAGAEHSLEPQKMPMSHRFDVLLRAACLAGVAFAPMAAAAQDAAASQPPSVAAPAPPRSPEATPPAAGPKPPRPVAPADATRV